LPASEADRDLSDDFELVTQAAIEAGRIAMSFFRADPGVWMKQGNSPVSEADIAVDRRLKEMLGAARPDYGWLSEETVDDPRRLARRRTFVVDPIDGTRAFLAGQTDWCVSIAVVEDGRSRVGVLDAPARGLRFHAISGSGAYCRDARLEIAPGTAALRVAGPKGLVDRAADLPGVAVRRMPYVPSLALRLAMIASGDLDATLVKANSHDWDIAAADLILAEAGGVILDAKGERPRLAEADPGHGELVAGGVEAARWLLPAIGEAPRR